MTKYHITRIYDDENDTVMHETADTVVAALEAAAIYLRDESCYVLEIVEVRELHMPNDPEDYSLSKVVMHYYRP